MTTPCNTTKTESGIGENNMPTPSKLTNTDKISVMVTVVDTLLKSGLPNMNLTIALGIAGNIDAESGFNYTILGDKGSSYGLCQWHAKRMSNLIRYCKGNGLDYMSPEGQVKFLIHELNNGYKHVYDFISRENIRNDLDKVTIIFCEMFEIPANKETVCPKRVNNARKVSNEYKKAKGIS